MRLKLGTIRPRQKYYHNNFSLLTLKHCHRINICIVVILVCAKYDKFTQLWGRASWFGWSNQSYLCLVLCGENNCKPNNGEQWRFYWYKHYMWLFAIQVLQLRCFTCNIARFHYENLIWWHDKSLCHWRRLLKWENAIRPHLLWRTEQDGLYYPPIKRNMTWISLVSQY